MLKNVVIGVSYYHNYHSSILLFYTKNNFLRLETFVLAHVNLLHKGHFFPYFFLITLLN